jgi:hypothetical protein
LKIQWFFDFSVYDPREVGPTSVCRKPPGRAEPSPTIFATAHATSGCLRTELNLRITSPPRNQNSHFDINHRKSKLMEFDPFCPHAHHDALEFPDGEILLLTYLMEGQQAMVLQLPAAAVGSKAPQRAAYV